MSEITKADLITAIDDAKEELSTTITTGLERLAGQIEQIRQDHAQHRLEQTKLNATFASRDRMEDLTRVVQNHTSDGMAINRELDELRDTYRSITTRLERMQKQSTEYGIGISANTRRIGELEESRRQVGFNVTGYLVNGLTVGIATNLAFLFNHVHW